MPIRSPSDPVIAGWGHTPFARHDTLDLEDLIVAAGREALAHAGLPAEAVDHVFVGHFNGGLVPDSFPASLALAIDPAMRFTPATRLENACASGSAAVFAARDAILAGRISTALVIGVEKMTGQDTAGVTRALASAAYSRDEADLSFPGIFAMFARAYFARHGDHSRTLARIAAKNHTNALGNPHAQMRKALDVDFCDAVSERNPMIAAPLRKTDCSLITDGAAALVLTRADRLGDLRQAVGWRAAVQVNDMLPMAARDVAAFEGPAEAFRRAWADAGVSPRDLDVAEVHDCFTIAELMIYEAMGLAEPGRGVAVLDDGTVAPGGALPVNLSGGLKAKGHPVGATGVSMHTLIARQITGTADGMQHPGAALGLVFNMGGSAVANYVSILEPLKR